MEKYLPYAVLFLRLALAITLLALVADKLGYWGERGEVAIMWGSWKSYEKYMHDLLTFLPVSLSENLAIVATLLEVMLALMLLFGLKVRWAAIGLGIYTLVLAVAILVFVGIKASLTYYLLVASAASFLLACCPIYKFTRHGIKKRSTYHPY